VDLRDVLDDLYGSPPAEFTATRDAYARQARSDGDRDLAATISGLRKPPVPAWAVNLLVRQEGESVEQLLHLGAAMREATASLAGPELRELSAQQGKVLDAMRVQATRLAREGGVKISLDVGKKIVATLRAGMADADAADAVRSGLLVRTLESTGFGESGSIDLDGATATSDAPARPAAATTAPKPARRSVPKDELKARREEKAAREAERERVEAERRERELRELQEAVEAAREELDDARDEASSAAGDLSSAQRRHDDLTRRRDDLQAKLDAVAEQLDGAAGTLRTAERAAHTADERVTRAERDLTHLENRLP